MANAPNIPADIDAPKAAQTGLLEHILMVIAITVAVSTVSLLSVLTGFR